ncbi:hypothetical protein [Deinococcus sp.]|uniref:hypothetical protein n=1 Tax=Deinococcus sp. TaxID=47478 RepID=UPI003C79B9F3
MTLIARIIALLGLILLVIAVVLMTKNVFDVNQQYQQLRVVTSSRGSEILVNPTFTVFWTAGAAALGGLLTGLGLGFSSRQRNAVVTRVAEK